MPLGVVVARLSRKLNEHFAAERTRPPWMLNPTDALLKPAAMYAPGRGRGVPGERDYGNLAGSVLMLLLLSPSFHGLADAEPLRIFRHAGSDKPSINGRGASILSRSRQPAVQHSGGAPQPLARRG